MMDDDRYRPESAVPLGSDRCLCVHWQDVAVDHRWTEDPDRLTAPCSGCACVLRRYQEVYVIVDVYELEYALWYCRSCATDGTIEEQLQDVVLHDYTIQRREIILPDKHGHWIAPDGARWGPRTFESPAEFWETLDDYDPPVLREA